MKAEGGPPRALTPLPSPRISVLSAITRAFAEETGDLPKLLQRVVEQTSNFLDGLCTLGVITDDGKGWQALAEFSQDAALLRDRERDFGCGVQSLDAPTVIAEAIREGTYARLDDMQAPQWLTQLPPLLAAHVALYNMRGMVAVPLRTKGRIIGALSVTRHGPAPRPLLDEDCDMLRVLANHAAQAITSSRHLADTQRELDEHKRTRQSLERSRELLQQAAKIEAVGRLAGGMAHDFNNALSVILSHAEALLDDAKDQATREDLGEIRAAALRAADLAQQLLRVVQG